MADKLGKKTYERELDRMQDEMVRLQEAVRADGLRVAVIFEGRDTAGKGGSIRRITEKLNPRHYRVVALPAPTERERGQWYFQRYIERLPSTGEIALFDRSWYNRAGVERVMGFCDEDAVAEFFREVPELERMLIGSGLVLVKYWLEVGPEEQVARLMERVEDPTKRWKISPVDVDAPARYDAYTAAEVEIFERTSTAESPWYVVRRERPEAGPPQPDGPPARAAAAAAQPRGREDQEAAAPGEGPGAAGGRPAGSRALVRPGCRSAVSRPSTSPKSACITASWAKTRGLVSSGGQRPERRSGWTRSISAMPGQVARVSAPAQARPARGPRAPAIAKAAPKAAPLAACTRAPARGQRSPAPGTSRPSRRTSLKPPVRSAPAARGSSAAQTLAATAPAATPRATPRARLTPAAPGWWPSAAAPRARPRRTRRGARPRRSPRP